MKHLLITWPRVQGSRMIPSKPGPTTASCAPTRTMTRPNVSTNTRANDCRRRCRAANSPILIVLTKSRRIVRMRCSVKRSPWSEHAPADRPVA
jgi:hypothetical protein